MARPEQKVGRGGESAVADRPALCLHLGVIFIQEAVWYTKEFALAA